MAAYAGFDLGLVFEMNTEAAPKARQVNDYPGADGLEVLDLGSRGGRTVVHAALGASTLAGLATLLQGLRSLQVAGTAGTLVDLYGTSWAGVILERFAPVGSPRPAAPVGYAQRYQAHFLHTS